MAVEFTYKPVSQGSSGVGLGVVTELLAKGPLVMGVTSVMLPTSSVQGSTLGAGVVVVSSSQGSVDAALGDPVEFAMGVT